MVTHQLGRAQASRAAQVRVQPLKLVRVCSQDMQWAGVFTKMPAPVYFRGNQSENNALRRQSPSGMNQITRLLEATERGELPAT